MTLVQSLYLVWGLYIFLGLLKTHLAAVNRRRYDVNATEEEQKKAAERTVALEYWGSMAGSLDWACGIIGAVLSLIYIFKG